MFESGLSYIQADFHLHTHKDKEFKYSGEQNSFVKDYVSGIKKAGINLGILTNHNKFDKDEYVAIRKAAKKEENKKVFILFRPFVAFFRYLRDSWREIRQVRWPSRKDTWKMVLAVVAYTALFVIIISLLDIVFRWLFGLILG